MSTYGIFTRISDVLKNYHSFDLDQSNLYRDKQTRNFEKKIMDKTNKTEFVRDLPKLWDICQEMRNILHDCTKRIEELHNTDTEKDNIIMKLQESVIEKDKIITELQIRANKSEANPPEIHKISPSIDQVKHKLMLEEKSGDKITGQQWTTVVKQGLRRKIPDCPVKNAYLTSDGVPTMIFSSAEDRDKAAETLKSDYNVKIQSQIPKKIAPKVKIIGVSLDIINDSDENIIEELKMKNSNIDNLIEDDDDFKIIYKNKDDRFIVIKTNPKIRDALRKSNDKIYCGLQILNVRDHVHPIQCFQCQAFGHYHTSNNCRLKDKDTSVCFYCANDHKSGDCKNKKNISKHRCANCIKEKRRNAHHKATDPLCPIVIRETLHIYDRTDGMIEESKNWYLQMIERIRQKRKMT